MSYVGDELTFADCFIVPQVFNANRFKVDMSQFPIISRVNEGLIKLDAVIASSPENQPDAGQRG
jgi:glutathione S-transferase